MQVGSRMSGVGLLYIVKLCFALHERVNVYISLNFLWSKLHIVFAFAVSFLIRLGHNPALYV